MSVLIEALTLVVRVSDVEERFPGGLEGLLMASLGMPSRPRFIRVCGEGLVALSFYGPEHLTPFEALLRSHGFDNPPEGAGPAMARIDQEAGPLAPCAWLDWERHEEGYTHAWPAGTGASSPDADDDRTFDRARALVRVEALDEARLFRLCTYGRIATWLDLSSGRQLVGWDGAESGADAGASADPSRGDAPAPAAGGWYYAGDASLEPHAGSEPGEDEVEEGGAGDEDQPDEAGSERGDALRARVIEILDAEGVKYFESRSTWLNIPFTADNVQVTVRVGPNADGHVLRLYALSDMRVPDEHRAAACEALTRANYGLPLGNFELDLADGEVVFKGTLYLGDDGELGGRQLLGTIHGCVNIYDRYYPALMRVIYGGATPEQAIAEVER